MKIPCTNGRVDSTSWLTGCIAFIAGGSSLLYETALFRLLSLRLGSSAQAVAAVLAAFLVGLALGNAVFGRLAGRSGRKWLVVAATQLAAALVGITGTKISPVILATYAVAARIVGPDSWQAITAAFLAGCAVGSIPAFFIGGSYPMLVWLSAAKDSQSNSAAWIYATGSFGCSLGSVLGGFWFLPKLGVNATLGIAAAGHVIAACVALLAGDVGRRQMLVMASNQQEAESNNVLKDDHSGAMKRWSPFVAILAGFTALAMEALWTRMLSLVIGHTAFSFSAVVSVYMAFVGAGGLIAAVWFSNVCQIVGRLGRLHIVLGAGCVGSVFLAEMAPTMMRVCYRWGGGEASLKSYVMARILVSSAVFGPVACCMGALFPQVVSAYSAAGSGKSPWSSGWAAGWISALATFGGVAGAVVAVFALAPLFGSRLSATAIGCFNVLVGGAILAADVGRGWRARIGGLAVSCIVLALTFAAWSALGVRGMVVARQFGASVLSHEEDASGAVTVLEKNGKRWITLNSTPIMAPVSPKEAEPTTDLVSGHLPMLLCPDAQEALFVGLGSGISLGAMSLYEARSLRTIEICPSVVRAAHFFDGLNFGVLGDPRTLVTINDGRNQLFCERKLYDAIGFDDWIAVVNGATPMATVEFLELVKTRLKRGGVYSSGPGSMDDFFRMELRTLLRVFKHVAVFVFPDTGCFYPVASEDPIVIDYEWLSESFRNPRVAESLAVLNISAPEDFIAARVCGTEGVARLAGDGAVCTDDLPLTMYDVGSCMNVDMFLRGASTLPNAKDILDVLAYGFENPMQAVRCENDARKEIEKRVARSRAALVEILRGAFILLDPSDKVDAFRRAKAIYPAGRYADFFMSRAGGSREI